jgi:putative ABC transport system permease protein
MSRAEVSVSDFRSAVRALRASPVVTAVAVLSLALGIGANTAMFSMIDALLLRPLPVPEADKLALVTTTRGGAYWWSNPVWEQIRDRPQLFDGAFAWSPQPFDLASSGQTNVIDGIAASGSFFQVLRVPAILGRTFGPADDRRDGGPNGPVAVISYSYWQRQFGGSPSAIGQLLTLTGIPFTIIGVTPPEFFGPEVGRGFDVAVPLGTRQLMYGAAGGLDSRSSGWLGVMVRLKPSQSVDAAMSVLRSVQPQIREATLPLDMGRAYRDAYLTDKFIVASASAGASDLRARYERPLVTLLVIVALVLLIACGNIANLQLARAVARRHELSVRTALGASRGRLVRQLLAESALLSATGAAFGVLIAYWASHVLVSQLSTTTSHVVLQVGIDWRMLGFAAAVATLTTILFGCVPAIRASDIQPIDALRQHGRDAGHDGRFGLGGLLVTGQLALSLLLLVGAGLFIRSFSSLAHLQPGFDADGILTVHANIEGAGIAPDARGALYQSIADRIASIPGVSRSAVSFRTPVCGCNQSEHVEIPGVPLPADDRGAWLNTVSPGWFATYGTPLRAGRDFDLHDRSGAPRAIIVNEAFVKKYFDGRDALGRVVTLPVGIDTLTAAHEIVGVVGNAVYRSLREPPPPTVYLPLAQRAVPWPAMTVSVRGAGAPALLVRSVTAAIADVEPRAKITFRTLSDIVGASLTQERQLAMLSGFFGALALLLSGVGLYGVTSYSVSRRRTEIGIRMALGTTPAGVMRLVFQRVGSQLMIGLIAGTLGAWWASRFVAKLLFGLAPGDLSTLGLAIVVLLAVAALAAFVPSQRAARIDPMKVLRDG